MPRGRKRKISFGVRETHLGSEGRVIERVVRDNDNTLEMRYGAQALVAYAVAHAGKEVMLTVEGERN